jgi:hypothetical protein
MSIVIKSDDEDFYREGKPLPPDEMREMIKKKLKLAETRKNIFGEKKKTTYPETRQDAKVEALEKMVKKQAQELAELKAKFNPVSNEDTKKGPGRPAREGK